CCRLTSTCSSISITGCGAGATGGAGVARGEGASTRGAPGESCSDSRSSSSVSCAAGGARGEGASGRGTPGESCSDSRSFSSVSCASAARGSQANNVAESSREGSLRAGQINLGVDTARIGGNLHPQVVALLCARAAQLEVPFARLARQHVGEPGLLGNGFLVLGMEQLDRGDLDVARALVLDFQPDRVVLAQLGVPY